MATKVLETVISVVDKTAAPFVLFNKRVEQTLRPVHKLEHSLKRLGRVSGFNTLKNGIREFSANSKNALQSFTNFGTSVGIVFGAAGFAVAKLNKAVLKLNEIEGNSDLFGIDVKAYQQLEYASKIAGVSMDSVGNGLKKMKLNAAAGSAAFAKVGLSARKIQKELISPQQAIVELADKFKNAGYTSSQKIQIATSIFGKSGVEIIALLNEGGESIQKWMEESENFGLMNREQADAAKAYAQSLARLKATFDLLVNSVGIKFLPELDKLVKSLTEEFQKNGDKYLDAFDKLEKSVPKFVDSLVKNLPKIIEFLGDFFNVVGDVVDRLGIVGPALTVAFGGIVMPLLGIITSLCKILWMPAKSIFSVFTFVLRLVGKLKFIGVRILKFLGRVLLFVPKITTSFKMLTPAVKMFGMAFKTALGPLGWILFAFEALEPLLDKISERWSELSFTSFDGLVHSFEILTECTNEWLDSLGLVGDIVKGIGKVGNKIVDFFGGGPDFSNIGTDDLGSMVLEAMNPAKGVEKSNLFQTSTTKTINNNVKQTTEFVFKGFPKDSVEVRQNGYNGVLYGNMIVPSF